VFVLWCGKKGGEKTRKCFPFLNEFGMYLVTNWRGFVKHWCKT
jgi:hypothetical protein